MSMLVMLTGFEPVFGCLEYPVLDHVSVWLDDSIKPRQAASPSRAYSISYLLYWWFKNLGNTNRMPPVQGTELPYGSVLSFLNNSRFLDRCTQLCTYLVIQHEALSIVAHYILRCFYRHGRTIHLQDGNKITATFPFQDAYFYCIMWKNVVWC